MGTFPVSVVPELSSLGDLRVLRGTLEQKHYTAGGQEFAAPGGIEYDVQLSNTGEAVLLTGAVRAHAQGACARCLEAATFDVEGEVQGYFFFEAQEQVEEMEPDEYGFVAEDGTVDILPAIVAGLVHETPYVVLCEEGCKGLCPKCGANLNSGPCGCDDDIDQMNPFAALKDFKFD